MTLFAVLLVASVGADLQFEAVTASRDRPMVGEWTALDAAGAATIGPASISAGDLIELRQVGLDLPALPSRVARMILVNGDCWPGSVVEIKSDIVRFAPVFGAKTIFSIPVTHVLAIWLNDANVSNQALELDQAKRRQDLARLANGDSMRGTLIAISGTQADFEINKRPVAIPRERIIAVSLANELTRSTKPNGPFTRLVLADGARISLSNVEWRDGRVIGKTIAGPTVRILAGDVAQLTVLQSRAVYLSDLRPLTYVFTPFNSIRWPFTNDRSVAGGALRIDRDVFDRGIGMHTQSLLRYAVPKGATRFEAIVGLNADSASKGRAIIRVAIGSEIRFGPMEIADRFSRRVTLAIDESSGEITLHSDFAGTGDVQGRVDWAEARFVLGRQP